jgi:hypothetical protein
MRPRVLTNSHPIPARLLVQFPLKTLNPVDFQMLFLSEVGLLAEPRISFLVKPRVRRPSTVGHNRYPSTDFSRFLFDLLMTGYIDSNAR